jgi:hypothetical protein
LNRASSLKKWKKIKLGSVAAFRKNIEIAGWIFLNDFVLKLNFKKFDISE